MAHEFLDPKFIEAMNELGEYGHVKHGEDGLLNSRERTRERHSPEVIARHALEHFLAYLNGIPHDHFKTRRHQLAAVAFNAMMEFHFAGLATEDFVCAASHDGKCLAAHDDALDCCAPECMKPKCNVEFSVNGHELRCTLQAGHREVKNCWGHWNHALQSGGVE